MSLMGTCVMFHKEERAPKAPGYSAFVSSVSKLLKVSNDRAVRAQINWAESILKYVYARVRYEPGYYVISFIYVKRLLKRIVQSASMLEQNICYIIVAAFELASCMFDDTPISTKSMASLMRLDANQLHEFIFRFMEMIDFQLFISESEFQNEELAIL